ncbi:MAG: Mur ligase family protein [Chlamydiota bacterium]
MAFFSIQEIADVLEIASQDRRVVSKVYVDSRLCKERGLYVALKGEKQDGHLFLEDAFNRGAIAALVQEDYRGFDFGLTLLRVKDPLGALQKLAKVVIKLRQPKMIGVTGSVGKTTIKEFVYNLLETTYKVDKTPDSYNGQIGLPLTILNAKQDAEVLVLEMGISYPGEMEKLIEIAPIEFAVVSHIAPVHIAHFSSVQHIALEKGKILSSPNLKYAAIHMHAEVALPKIQDRVIEVYATDADIDSVKAFQPPFTERHFLENLSAAVHIAKFLKVPDEVIRERIKCLKPFKHRFEKHTFKTYKDTILIDDTYNNNPTALKAILKSLPKPLGEGKTLAVLGEMRELGDLSKEAHENVAITALPVLDILICFGEATKPLYDVFKAHGKIVYHTVDKQTALEKVLHHLGEGDVLLCKGANFNRLWEVVEDLQKAL